MNNRTLSLCLALAALASAPAVAAPQAPQGQWIWDDGRVGVEFHPCGAALCGRIVWLKAESQPGAAPVLDSKNPSEALRRRRVCGIDYITGVTLGASGKWKGGRVYDFNSGGTYDLDIDVIEPARVTMRGYKGFRLLGATLKLIRPPRDLPRCAPASAS
ncbi:MAG: DUF2147 domain-containing protein [Novosphingobium sp.]|jgi:uncharacterized protein (DUF2147 family)|uniref:DUF2147 domain-containing protein n=1 Tax=Novosphingobium sp. TaxID=1874826 RepID=UPI00301845B2